MAYAIIIKRLLCQEPYNQVMRDNPSFISLKDKKIEELSKLFIRIKYKCWTNYLFGRAWELCVHFRELKVRLFESEQHFLSKQSRNLKLKTN